MAHTKNPSVKKLVNRALTQSKVHYPPKAYDGLQTLFKSMFVESSATRGLLGNPKSLSILVNGTPVETGGRPYGKFLCNCLKQGNWKYNYLRKFSDSDADYG